MAGSLQLDFAVAYFNRNDFGRLNYTDTYWLEEVLLLRMVF
jgi:hypothetical protein